MGPRVAKFWFQKSYTVTKKCSPNRNEYSCQFPLVLLSPASTNHQQTSMAPLAHSYPVIRTPGHGAHLGGPHFGKDTRTS